MKIKELRIGNYVNLIEEGEGFFEENREFKRQGVVSEISGRYNEITLDFVEEFNQHHTFDEIKPIPTTEKWLRDFGFEGTQFLLGKGNFTYHIENKTLAWFGVMFHNSLWDQVHKLQNLVFALTGEELVLKHS